MKFTKGYWMNRPGVENADCVQIREIKVQRNRVYLYAVPYAHDTRAMGGPVLELFLSSPKTDIIRIQAFHFMGSAKKDPRFEMELEDLPLNVEEFEGGLAIRSGKTELKITKNPASFTFYYEGKKLTNIGDRFGHAMISTLQTPEGPFMRVQMDLDIGEKVYGLGERFTPFVKNGQTVETWNEDGGTCTEISYKSIPFYMTNKGYGVLVNTSGKVSYEICSEAVTRAQFSVRRRKDGAAKLHSPRGAARAAPRLEFRPVANHQLHHLLRREDRARLCGRHGPAEHPPPRVPLRLLLDEGKRVVQLHLG